MENIIVTNKDGKEYTYSVPPCLFDNGMKPNATVYSDRLFQWDHKKHDALCKKHFGNEGQYWDNRNPEKIELFLKDYLGGKNIVLCRIEQHENQSTGYPLWRFDVNDDNFNI